MPAGIERGKNPWCMEAVDESHKHSVERIVFHELRVTVVGDRDPMLSGKSPGPAGVTARHGGHFSAADLASWSYDRPRGNPGGTEETYAHGLVC